MFFVGSTHFLWNIPGTNSQAKSNKKILVLFATCSKYWLSHVINISVSHISQALPQQGIDLHPCNQHPCSRLRDPVSWRWNWGETAVASSSGFLELHIWSLINLLFFFETFFCCYSIWARWKFLCRCGPNWEFSMTSRLHKGNTRTPVVDKKRPVGHPHPSICFIFHKHYSQQDLITKGHIFVLAHAGLQYHPWCCCRWHF